MKKIKLSNKDIYSLVDDNDYPRVKDFCWYYKKAKTSAAIAVKIKKKTVLLHRLIMEAPNGMDVDHINGNIFDNTKGNLRICSRAENVRNRMTKKHSSKFKGVSWRKDRNRWSSTIVFNYHKFHLGHFTDEVSAAKAYNQAAEVLFGSFARLNELLT